MRNYKRKLRLLLVSLLIATVAISSSFTPSVSITSSGGWLSISSNVALSAQLDKSQPPIQHRYEYEIPIVTKITDNYFEIDFRGSSNKVKIGTGTAQFVSRMLFGAFNDECQVLLELPSTLTGNLGKATLVGTGEDAVIVVENNAWKLEYKPTPPITGFNEVGGVDYIMTIKRKTSYNQLTFTYSGENVVAYHQPPLTQEEIDEGAFRPDHVVNSIVFYHSSKGGTVTTEDASRGITTGKVGHLYRMRVTDASNNTTWADWTLDGNTVTLTVPLAFLQSAVYPVVISPVGDTFGYTSIGASSANMLAGSLKGGIYTPGGAGTVTSMSLYTGNDSDDEKMFVYTEAGDYVCNMAEITSHSLGWNQSNYEAGNSSITVQSYVLGFWNEGTLTVYYDDLDEKYPYYSDTNYYTFPDPVTWSTSGVDRTWSIYVTYTPSASYDISNTPSSKAFGVVACSTTYYAFGSAPSNPVQDSECTFTITNNGATAIDLDMKISDFTGGVGWNIGAPAENQCRITAYYSGQNPASGLVLANTDAEFYDGLAASATIKWDFKFETPTSVTDGVAKEAILTITAVAED